MHCSVLEHRSISKKRGKEDGRSTQSWKRENRALCKWPKNESRGNGWNVKWSRNSCSLHFTFVISFSFQLLRSLSCPGLAQHKDFLRAFFFFLFTFFYGLPFVYVRVRITPTILSTRIVKIKIQALLCRIRTHSLTLHSPSFSSPTKRKKRSETWNRN